MFQKLKNLIDRYSWFVFIMMILVLFLNYIYPFDPSLSGLQLEWLIMTQVFPGLGIVCAMVAIIFKKFNLFVLALILYFALWLKLFPAFSFFTYFLGV
ncbi:TPA: hypothetical protein VJG34_001266 [Streptococcus pyogenes]|nr:hypothetical protein [Streptococcus pyogenes]